MADTRGMQPKPQNPKALFSYASFPRGAAAFQMYRRRPKTRRNLIKQKREGKKRKKRKETPKTARLVAYAHRIRHSHDGEEASTQQKRNEEEKADKRMLMSDGR